MNHDSIVVSTFRLPHLGSGMVQIEMKNEPYFDELEIVGWKFIGLSTTPTIIRGIISGDSLTEYGNLPSNSFVLRFNGTAGANIGNEEPYSQTLSFGKMLRTPNIKIHFVDQNDAPLSFTTFYLWLKQNVKF